jgi:hypothetical protein
MELGVLSVIGIFRQLAGVMYPDFASVTTLIKDGALAQILR